MGEERRWSRCCWSAPSKVWWEASWLERWSQRQPSWSWSSSVPAGTVPGRPSSAPRSSALQWSALRWSALRWSALARRAWALPEPARPGSVPPVLRWVLPESAPPGRGSRPQGRARPESAPGARHHPALVPSPQGLPRCPLRSHSAEQGRGRLRVGANRRRGGAVRAAPGQARIRWPPTRRSCRRRRSRSRRTALRSDCCCPRSGSRLRKAFPHCWNTRRRRSQPRAHRVRCDASHQEGFGAPQ